MASENNIPDLPLAVVARRCAEESDNFYRKLPYDPRFCYDLLRRAIKERDQVAWERVYSQYLPQISSWVNRHAAFPDSGEEVGFFVNRAIERMWTAISAERFSQFPDLKSLLRYLQLCVHSVILDHIRTQERLLRKERVSLETAERKVVAPAGEAPGLGQISEQELWDWLDSRLKNEKERKVVFSSFVLDFKPREIFEQYPDLFRDVKEVYRLKENILARLRRDPDLPGFLRGDA